MFFCFIPNRGHENQWRLFSGNLWVFSISIGVIRIKRHFFLQYARYVFASQTFVKWRNAWVENMRQLSEELHNWP